MNCSKRVFQIALLSALATNIAMAGNRAEAAAPDGMGAPGDHYLVYSGVATARGSANQGQLKFLYGEQHVLLYRDGRLAERVALYTCRDGSPFARKTVSYVDSLAPNFVLEDISNGMLEGVRNVGGGRAVFFRGDRIEPERVGPLPHTQDLVADTGFDEFIRTNWQMLMNGKAVDLPFLVPSRLEQVGFQAQRSRSDTVDGISVEVFRLKPGGVLGWVLPGIDVFYGTESHVLMRYQGISDLRDASGSNYQTEINFPADDRAPADEQQNSAAREAHLAACK
jgi:hypothetical protein